MTTKKQQEKKKFWIRVLCVVLAVLMIGSSIAAIFGVF
jgi:succinate dehydrogenase hydrophobic anchor subunit